MHRIRLLLVVALTLAGWWSPGVLVWTLCARLLRGDWPWQIGALEEHPRPGHHPGRADSDRRPGRGGRAGRRLPPATQRRAWRFDDAAAAAALLGADTAAARVAGCTRWPLSGDGSDQHRQQCIDVLCAYLRLPSGASAGLLNAIAVERALPPLTTTSGLGYPHQPTPAQPPRVRLTISSTSPATSAPRQL